jgi:endonuclease/exonuclease/phosphatase family metal-dependent hydrolase
MLTVTFWNIGKRQVNSLVGALVAECTTDVLVLAEFDSSIANLLLALNNSSSGAPYLVATGHNSRLVILSRLPPSCVKVLADVDGIAIREIVPPGEAPILVVAAHLRSKLHLSADDQTQLAVNVIQDIERAENSCGHSRTLVIGDLNMNPFEAGVVGASVFHVVSARSVASRGSRVVDGRSRKFFYNPSWKFFADSASAPGTYYYAHSGPVSYHWNVFDQVLLRPSLLPAFELSNLRVVTTIGGTTLLSSRGRPDTTVGSDHLPISVTLNSSTKEVP